MFHSWHKLAIGLAVAVCLIGAPCRECQPKEQAKHCGHDCCSKPKTQEPECKWQPAGYDATLEAKADIAPPAPEVFGFEAAETLVAPVQIVSPVRSGEPAHAHAPPIYLAFHNLLI